MRGGDVPPEQVGALERHSAVLAEQLRAADVVVHEPLAAAVGLQRRQAEVHVIVWVQHDCIL